MTVHIRQLQPGDIEDLRKMRLEGLLEMPHVFGGSYEEEVAQDFQNIFKDRDFFGAFVEQHLVGCAGFYIFNLAKMRHRGTLFGVYVKPEYRGQGLGRRLIETVIKHAHHRVLQLHCTVTTDNAAAMKLYTDYGFEIYGTEPRSLKIDDHFYDEHLMLLKWE